MQEGRKEMFYLTTHSTHMASDIWLRTILIARKESRCRHIGYSFRLTARVLLYAPSHRQDSTYHGLCYTSRGALFNSISAHSEQAVMAYVSHGHKLHLSTGYIKHFLPSFPYIFGAITDTWNMSIYKHIMDINTPPLK